jgi:hypothetical protein
MGVTLLTLTLAAPALAAIITVTGTGDTIAVDGFVTLREALTAANTNAASGDAPAGAPTVTVVATDPTATEAGPLGGGRPAQSRHRGPAGDQPADGAALARPLRPVGSAGADAGRAATGAENRGDRGNAFRDMATDYEVELSGKLDGSDIVGEARRPGVSQPVPFRMIKRADQCLHEASSRRRERTRRHRPLTEVRGDAG